MTRPDIAILLALPEEFERLALDYADAWTPAPNPNYIGNDYLFDGPNGYRCVAALMPRMGPTPASQVSLRLLAWRPAVIVNVGIAGGFKDDLRIGDVIVPREVFAYDETGKAKGRKWKWHRRGSAFRPTAELLSHVHELAFASRSASKDWRNEGAKQFAVLHTGTDAERIEDLLKRKLLRSEPAISTAHLASGSFVIASKDFAEFIRAANEDVHAGEMEAAGMLAASEYVKEPVATLVVRGISDHVDADKAELDKIGDGALRKLAMDNAWRLVTTLMHANLLPRAPAEATRTARPQPRLAPTRLPQGAPQLFGRETELAELDRLWDTDTTNVVSIVAWGGVGKTALVHEWRKRLLASDRMPELVFDWSFYSQGVRDRGAVSADSFLRAALIFFGDPELADSAASPWDKGARLAELVGGARALLILDGLEPLQHPKRAGLNPGELAEPSIAALLRGLAASSRGLCVVTTRLAVADLERFGGTLAPRLDLEHLSEQAGSALLHSMLGEVASSDAERREISREVRGHALTLELLGGYIRRALGDVRRWTEIDFARADEEQGGHAFRVMEAYVRWFSSHGEHGQRQLAVLRLLGLFDRPADPGCLEALRRAPRIAGLTDGLVGLDGPGWRSLVSSLVEIRLVMQGEYVAVRVRGYDEAMAELAGERVPPVGEPKDWPLPDHGRDALVLDAHPLVREYFGRELREASPDAWREGHRRVYEHLCGSVPYWPEGVEGLQPLYQAVTHGCAAGRVEEVRARVYRARILRGNRFYSTKQLGAFSADLWAVACLFERTWDLPSAELSAADRSWVLGQAAFRLRALGRLSEALEPMRASLEMAVKLEDWKNAAIRASNLSDLELKLGRTDASVEDAAQSVEYADHSADEFQRIGKRTTLADARHQAGDHAGARELFEQAEDMQAERQPSYPRLYSLAGHRYCDLLLSPAERAAWRAALGEVTVDAELVAHCSEVFVRAIQTLAWVSKQGWLLDIALDHLTLGRAALYAAMLHAHPAPTPTAPELSYATAQTHLDAAVDGLRRAGTLPYLPCGLVTRAILHHHLDHPTRARADLDEADQIASRGPMPLHQADIQLTRARLFHDRTALANARALITAHAYGRRLPELEDAEHSSIDWPPTS